ncbi:MAG TPA: hypothetical protein VNO33_01920 [Kofleriaceae bacterium]|nr:hypothetical protein [Kofleriaceae bacterium]
MLSAGGDETRPVPIARPVAGRLPVALVIVAALSACRDGRVEQAPVRRYFFPRVTFDPRGLSPPIRVRVPAGTRSIAVVAEGDRGALYGMAVLETSDGIEHVALPGGVDLPAAMRAAYHRDRSGEMPGRLRQSIRLGLFTLVFPDRPGVALPAGDAELRIATSDPSHVARLEVLLPEEIGAAELPVNIFTVSREKAPADPGSQRFLAPLRAILAGGGVALRVERVIPLASELASMTELSEPQEPPDSASSRLALLGGAMTEGPALNIFVIDSLPSGVGGWTLGTPGPPPPDTYYSGVVVARLDGGDELARVLAHELCHYLGLWHVQHASRTGALHRDPLDDTEPDRGNLMDEAGKGTLLTPGQRFVLARHPLLRPVQ